MLYKVIHQSTDISEIDSLSKFLTKKGISPKSTLEDSLYSIYLPITQIDRFIRFIPELKEALAQN